MSHENTTLVIGLDAACWEYLDPLLEAGRLPHLAGLVQRGVSGLLNSTTPPITPVAWSSLVTGVNPGKHGVFAWTRRSSAGSQLAPVSSGNRIGTPVWARLNAAGIQVGVVNVPLTYPAEELDGFMLCGFSTPASARDLTYPPELLAEVEGSFGPYEPIAKMHPHESTPEEFYDSSRTHQSLIVRIAAGLAKSKRPQVLIINLMLMDHTNHEVPSMGLVEQAMIDTDADLGLLLDELTPDNVMLISDHGSRRVKGMFLLGAWLAEHGFLVREERHPSQRAKVVNYALQQWMNGKKYFSSALGRRLLREGLTRLPASLTRVLWDAIERDTPLARMHVETVDSFVPGKTQVFLAGANQGSLRLNLAGRDPDGSVAREESAKILARLVRELEAIRDPITNEPLFSQLHLAQELFEGPFTCDAPDLIGAYHHSDWSISATLSGVWRRPWRYFVEGEGWSGDHSQEGIYVFAGRDFAHQSERGRADLVDIPATLLHLYDVALPEDYDGKPLHHVMNIGDRPIRYQPGDDRSYERAFSDYTEEEELEVLERLSQLGYVG